MMVTDNNVWSDYMENDVCNEYSYRMYQNLQLVRLMDRKKAYIEEFQKAKDEGMILKLDKVIKKPSK